MEKDIEEHLPALTRVIDIIDTKQASLPVAFASNALYVLERHGLGNKEDYERLLLPILREKAQYLHVEGVA